VGKAREVEESEGHGSRNASIFKHYGMPDAFGAGNMPSRAAVAWILSPGCSAARF